MNFCSPLFGDCTGVVKAEFGEWIVLSEHSAFPQGPPDGSKIHRLWVGTSTHDPVIPVTRPGLAALWEKRKGA